MMLDLLKDKREQILQIAARYGVSDVRVFGSVARDDAGPGSDVDLLVHLGPELSLLSYVALKQDLEDLLGMPVDVVDEAGLHPRIRERVLQEAVPL
jgi:predicted nucleotidyltransferase